MLCTPFLLVIAIIAVTVAHMSSAMFGPPIQSASWSRALIITCNSYQKDVETWKQFLQSPQVNRQRDTKRKNPLSMSLSAHYLNKADPRVLHTCTRFRYATISCQRRFYVASVADVHTPISCSWFSRLVVYCTRKSCTSGAKLDLFLTSSIELGPGNHGW